MDAKNTNFLIDPLALYILAVAEQDGAQEILERFVKTDWLPLPPRYFEGFKEESNVFGHPDFVREENVARFFSGLRRREKAIGTAMVKMIRELRYTMEALAANPILVDTGQYKPKYQDRTYSDMENQIARDLIQQPNFQAKVKILTGEYDIRTNDPPRGITDSLLEERINQIKLRMTFPTFGYYRYYRHVEKEIRERQERWLERGSDVRGSDGPPPSYI